MTAQYAGLVEHIADAPVKVCDSCIERLEPLQRQAIRYRGVGSERKGSQRLSRTAVRCSYRVRRAV